MKKILNIWNSSFSGKLCGGMKPAHFVASSKGINLLKDIKNYKDKAYNTLTTYSLHVPEIQKRVQSA